MKLVRARVTDFKSIDDSGWVDIDDVTCMVGKNESGKTGFLDALKRLNPVDGHEGFALKDYPRKGYVKYKRRHEESPAIAITALFQLSDDELGQIESELGQGVLKSSQVSVSKDYKNNLHWDFEVDDKAIVQHILNSSDLPPEVQQHASPAENCEELLSLLQSLDVKPASVDTLIGDLSSKFSGDVGQQIIEKYFEKFLPKFVYFDEYSTMRGRISLQDMRERLEKEDDLDDSDRTFLSLLSLVGADIVDMENQTNYEYLKAEMESASIGISDEIFEYWNQNKQLRVEFDLSPANPNDPSTRKSRPVSEGKSGLTPSSPSGNGAQGTACLPACDREPPEAGIPFPGRYSRYRR